ncbi:MAG: hypothetical protein U9R00_00030 [Patescibacteria group bacterium]|nr:hypothetical protein [Patescibacteria group bacterium]
MGIHLSTLLKYYKRPDIQKEIYYNAENREVAVRFDKGFGKRPDTLQYSSDVLEFAKQKATSFHFSEEIWKNPLQITTGMAKKELNALRRGWDLVLDIDGNFDFSRIVAKYVIKFLESMDIKGISCKFSGNKGFHIGVPFESFPKEVHGHKVETLFPEAPRRVAAYIWEMIQKPLAEELMKKYTIEKLQEITKLPFDKITIMSNGKRILNPKTFVDIDTVLISSRHLYRSAYSFNEKSGLVSLPIRNDRVESFSKIEAKPENVRVSKHKFLDREIVVPGEAKKLLEKSFDWTFDEKKFVKKIYEAETKKMSQQKDYEADELAEAIPEEYFPPCVLDTFKGLKDGKKRSLFILVNFLTSVGWDYEKIEKRLMAWNKVNENELKEGMIKTHVRYHKVNKKKILPPNCNNEAYYQNIGICKPDNLCAKIKNPVQYAKIKFKYADKNKGNKKKIKKTKMSKKKEKTEDKVKEEKKE